MSFLENKNRERKNILLSLVFSFFLLTFLTNFVGANSGCATLPKLVQRNTDFQIYQDCNNCTYCNFTFFTPSDPYGVEYLADTDNSWRYYSNLTSGNSSEIGRYTYNFICGNSDERITGCIDFQVTPTGDYFDQSQSIVALAQIGAIALFVILGFSFKKEKWKLKTFFFICSLMMTILLLNSVNIMISSSEGLYKMGQISLVVAITILAIMSAYFLINVTIETLTYFRKRKNKQWRMNDYA